MSINEIHQRITRLTEAVLDLFEALFKTDRSQMVRRGALLSLLAEKGLVTPEKLHAHQDQIERWVREEEQFDEEKARLISELERLIREYPRNGGA